MSATKLCYWADPVDLDVDRFKKLMTNDDNAFIFVYMTGCGHCEAFKPTFKKVARLLHETYNERPDVCLPIVVAQIEGASVIDALNKHFGKQVIVGFPTLIFKRSDKKYTVYDGVREEAPILAKMAAYLEDATLQPDTCYLGKVMPEAAAQAEFAVLYQRAAAWTPRTGILPRGVGEGARNDQMNATVCRSLRSSAAARRGGVAIAVDDEAAQFPPRIREIFMAQERLTLPAIITADGRVLQGRDVYAFLEARNAQDVHSPAAEPAKPPAQANARRPQRD